MGFDFRADDGISAKNARLCIGTGARGQGVDGKVGIAAGRQGEERGGTGREGEKERSRESLELSLERREGKSWEEREGGGEQGGRGREGADLCVEHQGRWSALPSELPGPTGPCTASCLFPLLCIEHYPVCLSLSLLIIPGHGSAPPSPACSNPWESGGQSKFLL